MLLALAWKNLWRNRTRSLIILAAIALGLLGGLLAAGVNFGMGGQMIAAAIDDHLSDLQIHHAGFRESADVNDTIRDAPKLVAEIAALPGVAAVAQKVVVTAMAASPTTAAGVRLVGIEPDREQRVTDIHDRMVEGSYFGSPIRNPAVIGGALARELDLENGSKVVFTFQNDSGEITGGAFRIVGIYKTVSSNFDKSNVFVEAADLQRLIGSSSAWHEIAVVLKPGASLDSAQGRLRALAGGLQVDTWKQLAPDLAYVSESLNTSLYLFLAVILAALGFGIVNTMLMAVLERRRELGMLMAIGMKRKTIFGMIVLETAVLSLTGAGAGMALTAVVMAILRHIGIDLSILSQGLGRFGIAEVLYPSLPISIYPILAAMVVATAIIAAIYPAVKALRLRPSQALRTM